MVKNRKILFITIILLLIVFALIYISTKNELANVDVKYVAVDKKLLEAHCPEKYKCDINSKNVFDEISKTGEITVSVKKKNLALIKHDKKIKIDKILYDDIDDNVVKKKIKAQSGFAKYILAKEKEFGFSYIAYFEENGIYNNYIYDNIYLLNDRLVHIEDIKTVTDIESLNSPINPEEATKVSNIEEKYLAENIKLYEKEGYKLIYKE